MAIQPTRYIWNNGKLKAWDDVKVHVLTHALHYGSSIFEGIRVYATPKGPQFFRLTDHIRRMFDSANIYQMKLPYSREQLAEACHMVVAENGLESAYVRPIAFCGYGSLGIDPGDQAPEVAIAAMEWGAFAPWSREAKALLLVGNGILLLMLWHRAKQRSFYYVREVLLTAERVLDDRTDSSSLEDDSPRLEKEEATDRRISLGAHFFWLR